MNVGFGKKASNFCRLRCGKKGAKILFGLQMKSLVQWLAPLIRLYGTYTYTRILLIHSSTERRKKIIKIREEVKRR